ncbi:hypothetical protein M413DRAFT_438972 [Hebeloma cylindrosporum]|uniref:Uncharacterized protein n=1 Tax=Hebeloma cylindrosporum TaxID=76867 RepID=A0A0C2Z9M8_HEBCY|nr:hypothetical protein M413DRAFT_438972 [Hebeloma cylindrosporum h7]
MSIEGMRQGHSGKELLALRRHIRRWTGVVRPNERTLTVVVVNGNWLMLRRFLIVVGIRRPDNVKQGGM